MADRIDDLSVRMQAVETRMDLVPATIDQRFDAVDMAIAEQRQFTEFAFEKLERRMETGFAEVKAELKAEFKAELKAGIGGVNGSIARLERKLDQFIDRFAPPPPSDTPESPK